LTDIIDHPLGQVYFYSEKLPYMSVIILLLVASILVAALFLGAFIWSVTTGQYEDEVAPAVRILFDDHPANTGIPDADTSIPTISNQPSN
jgi:cbb3-type cytochrome oxidase maturation protein